MDFIDDYALLLIKMLWYSTCVDPVGEQEGATEANQNREAKECFVGYGEQHHV